MIRPSASVDPVNSLPVARSATSSRSKSAKFAQHNAAEFCGVVVCAAGSGCVHQGVNQLVFHLHNAFGILQRRTVNQKYVFDALIERGDLGGGKVDAVSCQHDGDGKQKADTVVAGDAKHPAALTLVALDFHDWRHRETSAAARELSFFGFGERLGRADDVCKIFFDACSESFKIAPALILYEECVQRPAVDGRVNARVENRKTFALEKKPPRGQKDLFGRACRQVPCRRCPCGAHGT